MAESNFASWFGRELVKHEWTQADFARRSKFSTGSISNWATGTRIPDPTSCDVIADILGVDRDKVLALAGHRPPDVELAPDDPVVDLMAIMRKIEWDEDRVETIRGIIGRWYDRDLIERKKREREREKVEGSK